MRVIVCGGRDYSDSLAVERELDALFCAAPMDTMIVIQGAAKGADELARAWAHRRLVEWKNYPADWRAHGKAAGPMRNQRMIDDGRPDLVLAFPGGRGTADMTRRAQAAGVPVRVIAARLNRKTPPAQDELIQLEEEDNG